MADIKLEQISESVCKKFLRESSLGRLLSHSKDDGYIIVSACRHEFDDEENWNRTKELKSILNQSPFSYIPSTGSYPENDAETGAFSHDVREHSFIVFPRSKSGERLSFDDLDWFGRKLCKRFGQDSILQRKVGETAKYVKADKTVDMDFTDPPRFNRDEPYFTALGRHSKSNLTRPRTGFRDKFSF